MKADVALVGCKTFGATDSTPTGSDGPQPVTLNGVPTTIVGVIPNPSVAWFGRDLEVITVKALQVPGLTKRADSNHAET